MKKLTALAIALTMLLSFAACNSEGGGTAEADVTTAAGNVTKEIEENTETEENTVPNEVVEPAAEDFEYNYDAALKGAVITKYNGSAEAIRIPTELDGDPVVQFSMGKSGNKSIKHVEIPDGITSISYEAFYDCSNLESVIIPDSVTEIGVNAFYGCSNLKSVIIPNSVKKIGESAFEDCTSLESVIIPSSIREIGKRAFKGCLNLKNVDLPNIELFLDSEVFANCGFTEITISKNINHIEPNSFSDCKNLEKVTFEDGFRHICGFQNCVNLKEIIFSGNVLSIDANAFSGCKSLSSISLPDSISKIGAKAFENCTKLRTLNLSENIESLDKSCFSGCEALTVSYNGKEYTYEDWDSLYMAIKRKNNNKNKE